MLDIATPRSGLNTTLFNELLEVLKVALDTTVKYAQHIADFLSHLLGLIPHLQGHARRHVVNMMERYDASVM